jgi:hypothetical protein
MDVVKELASQGVSLVNVELVQEFTFIRNYTTSSKMGLN